MVSGSPQRERPRCGLSELAEVQRGRDAVARIVGRLVLKQHACR